MAPATIMIVRKPAGLYKHTVYIETLRHDEYKDLTRSDWAKLQGCFKNVKQTLAEWDTDFTLENLWHSIHQPRQQQGRETAGFL